MDGKITSSLENLEIETCFLIDPSHIEMVIKKIKKIGLQYNFLSKNEKQYFTDFYFDNKKYELSKKKLALRLRIFENKKTKVALKKTKKVDKLFSERLEIEDDFSKNIMSQIMEFLKLNQIELDAFSDKIEDIDNMDPTFVFNTLGLKIIQTRTTSRNLVHFYTDSEIFYEFAIDNTTFKNNMKYISLEIESKSPRNTKQENEALVCHFLDNSNYAPFRIWKYNKLITGFAIDELFSSGRLTPEHFDSTNFLKYSAMDMVENYLDVFVLEKKFT